MRRPHAKHHNGLYPTYPKLRNIFRGQVNVWKLPRDLGGIQDLILSWKQAASNINLIQYKCSTLEKNKWRQMWRYALVGSRRLGSWTKSIRRQNKKRKQTTHPEGCRRFLKSCPLTYHATKPAIQFFTPFCFARCLSRRARREYKFQQWGDKSLHDPRLEAHDRPWDKGIRSGKGLKTLPRPRHSSPAVFMLQIAHCACFPITKNDWNPCAQNDFPPGLFDLLSSWLYTDQDYSNCMVVHRKFYLPTDFHLCNRTSSANPRGPKQKIRPKQKMAAPQIWWTGFSDTWIKLKHSKTFANKNCCKISETARHRKSSRIFHTSWLHEIANPCSVCAQCLKKHGLVHQKARAKQRQKEHETMSDGIPKLFLQKWENIKHHIIHSKMPEFSVFIRKRTSTFENEKQAHACLQHGANLDAAPSQSYAQRSPREHPLVLQLVGECRWLWSLWKKSAAMSWKM